MRGTRGREPGGGRAVGARSAVLGLLLLALAPAAGAGEAALDARVFLIGDAGVPRRDDAVLAALERDVAADPASAVVVFLGDNIYPRGLPPEGAANRDEARRRLDAQVAAARAAGLVLFIPGNHDWDRHSAEGWNAIRRQADYLAATGTATLEPGGGCPGPVVRDVHDRVRLVLLDTQWWLQGGPKPVGPSSDCPEKTEGDVERAVAAALAGAPERRVIVAGHHPLQSRGEHGGRFTWKDHLFPLTRVKRWLWLPLPIVGSLYPMARQGGIVAQDFSGARYVRLRRSLGRAFASAPPLAYASGHEHNLQVLRGVATELQLVSGAGSHRHRTPVGRGDRTLFARSAGGYMRLDVGRDGRARLAVVTVDDDGRVAEQPPLDLAP
jgi:hypothetical protein